MIRFKVQQESVTMKVTSFPCISMTVESAVKVGSSGQIYDGSYEITPKVDGQTMNTKDKYMLDDVNVHPIPFFSVGNDSGGNTVYIGSEVVLNGNF